MTMLTLLGEVRVFQSPKIPIFLQEVRTLMEEQLPTQTKLSISQMIKILKTKPKILTYYEGHRPIRLQSRRKRYEEKDIKCNIYYLLVPYIESAKAGNLCHVF